MGTLIKTGKTRYFPAPSAGTVTFVQDVSTASSTGSSPASPSITPSKIGDLMVLLEANYSGGSSNFTLNSASGGGVSSWTVLGNHNAADLSGVTLGIAYGTVGSLTPAAVTASLSGSCSSSQICVVELTGLASWAVGSLFPVDNAGSGTLTLPSLTVPTGDLYLGLARTSGGIALTLLTAGYTDIAINGNGHVVYGGTGAPQYSLSTSSAWTGLAFVVS